MAEPYPKQHGGTYIPPSRSRHLLSEDSPGSSRAPSQVNNPKTPAGQAGILRGHQSPPGPSNIPLVPRPIGQTSTQPSPEPQPVFTAAFTHSPSSTGTIPSLSTGDMNNGYHAQVPPGPQRYAPQQVQSSSSHTVGGMDSAAQYNNRMYSSGMGNSSRTYTGSTDADALSHSAYASEDLEKSPQVARSNAHALHHAAYMPKAQRSRIFAPFFYWTDFFLLDVRFRWKKQPRLVKPGVKYPSHQKYRLRDHMDRVIQRREDDRYISCYDGKVKELIVQSCDDLFYGPNEDTWMRTRICDRTPWHLRVVDWVVSSNTDGSRKMSTGRYFAGVFLLSLPVFSTRSATGTHFAFFEAFPYRLHGYAEVSRNPNEDPDRWHQTRGAQQMERKRAGPLDRIEDRVLGPSLLCTVSGEQFHVNVHNWNAVERGRPFPEYVFVAYTAEQFPTREHEDLLNEIGARAARDAGVGYYWVGCSAMGDVGKDVYRISDIVRAATRVVVAISPSNKAQTPMAMLKQFGTRVWTFPEILLAPRAPEGILVYSQGLDTFAMSLNQFARDVWSDSLESRQLIDHFNGSLHLSNLELATVGLKCFYSRHLAVKWPGDKAYAMMGLLRLRPPINPGESAFQAFARMSLLGHNEALLERLICVQPTKPNQPWYDMTDAYDAQLWDIYPRCQVSGVGHADSNMDETLKRQVNDTVIVDGMRGAKVRWKSFAPVARGRVRSWKRAILAFLLRSSNLMLLIGLILLGTAVSSSISSAGSSSYYGYSYMSMPDPTLIGSGVLLFLFGLGGVLLGPKLLLIIYGGKYWNVAPWLFGVEGYVDIRTLEGYAFGINQGFLKWSPFGSPLSRHHKDEYGEIVGDDPMTYPEVRERVEAAMKSREPGRPRIFILVDTHTMTATLFESVRPPIGFLLAGSEGGHQRAIGVSFDWKTNTLYREVVLRMESTALDRMLRVPRVRMGLQRPIS